VRVGRLLRSLAGNVATHATATTLAGDTGGPEVPLKDDTVREYLNALTRLMIVEDQPAWAPHLRSKYVLRSSPKRHFVDPSLAVAALRATPARLLRDLNLLGFLFESMVIRDLRVYAQPADAQVFQYRDSSGLEIDAVVEAADGRWGRSRSSSEAASSSRGQRTSSASASRSTPGSAVRRLCSA